MSLDTLFIYQFIAICMFINLLSIFITQTYISFFVVPKLYKTNYIDYERLVLFLVDTEFKPLSIFDTLTRYFIPLYGLFMSLYLIYFLDFCEDIKYWQVSSKFKYAERELQKFRIFKRKDT